MLLDVHAANRAALVGGQPLVHTDHVEQVHAGQAPDFFIVFKLAQADGAFLHVVLVVTTASWNLLILVRKGVPFYSVLGSSTVDHHTTVLKQPHSLLNMPREQWHVMGH